MSTDLCKNYLVQQFPNTTKKDWKRIGKKTSGPVTKREFSNSKNKLQKCSVYCGPYGMFSGFTEEQHSSKETLEHSLFSEIDIETCLFGGNSSTIPPGTSPEQTLIILLDYGIDWSAPNRITLSDLHNTLNWTVLTQDVPNIHQKIVLALLRDFNFSQEEDEWELSNFFCPADKTNPEYTTNTLEDYRLLLEAYEKTGHSKKLNPDSPTKKYSIDPNIIKILCQNLEEFRFFMESPKEDEEEEFCDFRQFLDAKTKKYIHQEITSVITALISIL